MLTSILYACEKPDRLQPINQITMSDFWKNSFFFIILVLRNDD